jgi:hypothetical protein
MSHSHEHCCCRELSQILKLLKELHMSQVQLTVSFNVVAAAAPLTVTPASATENLTVGVAADGTAVASVTGGVAPYTYALDPASGPLPAGITFDEDGSGNITLAGTPTAAGTSSVILDITDAAGNTAQVSSAFKAK